MRNRTFGLQISVSNFAKVCQILWPIFSTVIIRAKSKTESYLNFKAISDIFSVKLLPTRGRKQISALKNSKVPKSYLRGAEINLKYFPIPFNATTILKKIFRSRFNNLQIKKIVFAIPYCSFSYNSCIHHFTYNTQQKQCRNRGGIPNCHRRSNLVLLFHPTIA